jgi:SEC-C motif
MMNRFGLKRSDLTSEQKRLLRQEAGFGCVCCGNAICTYEHISPEFANAQTHDVIAMAYICHQCHGKVTRGHLSKDTILRAKASPKSKQEGFSFEAFDVGSNSPKVHFGPMSSQECESIIKINGRSVFSIGGPEEEGGPFRLNAEIRGKDGVTVFSIVDNEWQVRADNWDVEVVGNRITVRSGSRDVAFCLRTDPSVAVYVERMDLMIEGNRIYCDGRLFSIESTGGGYIEATALEFYRCENAVLIENGSIQLGTGGGSVTMSGIGGQGPAKRSVDPSKRRNEICACGSIKKYKHCCGSYS